MTANGRRWARGFLTALSKIANVTALAHTYEVAWPKGNVFWRGYDKRLYPDGWDCEAVSYPVLKYVREWWWRFAYAAKAKKIIREKGVDVVLIYNCYESWQVPVLRAIKTAFPKVRVVPIILDGDDPRKDDWGWMKRAAEYADGFISLSWWIHKHIPENVGRPSYHMDGGADGWRGLPPDTNHQSLTTCRQLPATNHYTLVHTGALDQWRGLDFMVEVIRQLTTRRKDVKFVFCGKSSEAVLKRIFSGNPYVELPGFVSEDEMVRICNSADVLLNVRNPDHPDNILNYPSKLPHYLSFGRPVVSTRLQSLSPEYGEIVHFAEDDTVKAYVDKLEEVLGLSEEDRNAEHLKIKEWFCRRKRWDILARGVVEWVGK